MRSRRPHGFWRIGRVILVGLLSWSCATSPAREIGEEEQRSFDAAVSAAERSPAAASRRLQIFLEVFPDSPLSDQAKLTLGELALAQDDDEAAIDWLERTVGDHGSRPSADRARLLLAGIDRRNDRSVEARRLLARIHYDNLSAADQRLAYRLRADLSIDPVDRLGWRVKERAAAREELRASHAADAGAELLEGGLEDLELEIRSSLEAMTNDELSKSVRKLRGESPAATALLLLSKRALEVGDLRAAKSYFKRAKGQGDASLRHDLLVAIELRERIGDEGEQLPTFAELAALPAPSTEDVSGTLGVVLPLSGRFASYGEESLRGVLLATRIFDPVATEAVDAADGDSANANEAGGAARNFEGTGIRLVIRDSQGTPQGAVAAVRELAQEEDLVAIVGPLLGAAAEAAAVVAQEAEVPLITLTSRESVPVDRSYIFRVRTTPADEIRSLIHYAAGDLEAKRFAILYPKDNYGRGMRDRFWEAVTATGGEVVAASGYDPDATDFAEPIRRMIGYTLLTRAEKEKLERRAALLRRGRRLEPRDARLVREVAYAISGPEGDPLPPIVDFDALFIPDSHDKIVLIAPQLSFHEIGDVRLLGTGDWHHPDLVTIGRGHVRGAVISSLFHKESRFPFVAKFVADYTATFDTDPEAFSAHAYDAMRLVLIHLRRGEGTRESVRDGVLRTQGFAGASGVISMLPDGNALKRPFLLEVRGKRIISLD